MPDKCLVIDGMIMYDQCMDCRRSRAGLAEDWELLTAFLPLNWRELAVEAGALKGLRKDKSAENLLRLILIHLGCGYSLRETTVWARKAQLADLTAPALWHRMRKAKNWLHALCMELWREQGLKLRSDAGLQLRLLDGTTVREPGKTGSDWRLHYSLRLPSLTCDFFKLTETSGAGSRESFTHFPVNAGDYLLAHRGFSTAKGLLHVDRAGGYATVRLCNSALSMRTGEHRTFDLLAKAKELRRTGAIGSWPVEVVDRAGAAVLGRVCALRKTRQATRTAHNALRRKALKEGTQLQPEAVDFAKFVILFTTFSDETFTAESVLEWYRTRWQVALVFKRFKSLAQLGHLPKRDDESGKAWLYGKLLAALLIEKLIRHAGTISPWGYHVEPTPAPPD